MTFGIKPVGPEDRPACAALLAEAFTNDPVYLFIWPDEEIRREKLPRLFEFRLPLIKAPAQQVWMARDEDEKPAAVSVWDTTGRPSNPNWARATPEVTGIFGARLAAAEALVRAIDEFRPTAPHWYLDDLATAPTHRGGGAGLALLQNRFDHCDRQGIDVYGVCTQESTIGFYEKCGAIVAREIRVPHGPRLWGMLRLAH
ncbi:GNAT family N-acetyltransferase [Nocardia goodfellowii]